MFRLACVIVLITASFAVQAADYEGNVVVSKYNFKGDTLYDSVEVMPRPLVKDLNSYLSSTLQYPIPARDNGIEGRVVVAFVIDQEGFLGAAIVVKSSGNTNLDDEALRVARGIPQHSPGMHNNIPVPVYIELPITFSLH